MYLSLKESLNILPLAFFFFFIAFSSIYCIFFPIFFFLSFDLFHIEGLPQVSGNLWLSVYI